MMIREMQRLRCLPSDLYNPINIYASKTISAVRITIQNVDLITRMYGSKIQLHIFFCEAMFYSENLACLVVASPHFELIALTHIYGSDNDTRVARYRPTDTLT